MQEISINKENINSSIPCYELDPIPLWFVEPPHTVAVSVQWAQSLGLLLNGSMTQLAAWPT